MARINVRARYHLPPLLILHKKGDKRWQESI